MFECPVGLSLWCSIAEKMVRMLLAETKLLWSLAGQKTLCLSVQMTMQWTVAERKTRGLFGATRQS